MQPTQEQWLPIPGYEGRYDVSDQGRVRSWLPYRGIAAPRELSTEPNNHGYIRADLCKDHRKTGKRVHQLVLLAFVGPRPDGMEIRHLDGNKVNNVLSNLRYGTSSENKFDTVRHGTFNNGSGAAGGDARLKRTHCRRGHAFDAANTKFTGSGARVCRTCLRAYEAQRPARVR